MDYQLRQLTHAFSRMWHRSLLLKSRPIRDDLWHGCHWRVSWIYNEFDGAHFFLEYWSQIYERGDWNSLDSKHLVFGNMHTRPPSCVVIIIYPLPFCIMGDVRHPRSIGDQPCGPLRCVHSWTGIVGVSVLKREHYGEVCGFASTLCKCDLGKGYLFVLSWARVGRVFLLVF